MLYKHWFLTIRRQFDKSQEIIIVTGLDRAYVFRIRHLPRVGLETDMQWTRIVIVLTKTVNVFNNII